MRKGIKIFLSFISSIVLLIIVLPVFASILLSSYYIQNWAAGKFTRHFSNRLGTTVSLDHIGIKLFNRITLDGFYVEDLQGDTLIYVRYLDAGFRGYNPLTGSLRLGDVRIEGADFRLAQDSTGTTNLKYITEKLRAKNPPENRKPFILNANRLTIDSTRFRLQKFEIRDRPAGINFDDMDVRDISLDIERIGLINDSIRARINRISAREKSGFFLRSLSAQEAAVSSTGIHLEKFRMEDPDSRVLMPELHLDYPYWRAFNNYVEEVHMRTAPQNSVVSFRTIGWFAPALREWESVVRLNGTINGTVSALSGELDTAVINDTRLNTRFAITGLPDITQTRFELDVKELSTHTADALNIVRDVSGKELGHLSPLLSRLEEIRITGKFAGLLTDFLAEGKIQSTPGEIDFDVRLLPERNGRTGLNGSVRLENFSAGQVLAHKELGDVTIGARVDGFFGTDTLRLGGAAHVDHLRYRDYDYRDIDIDGEIRNHYYQGTVASHDTNIDFRLEGEFDFNEEIPRYDFALALNRLDLQKLGINRRDSISVLRADMRIKARGTTLDDITGNGMITDLVYVYPGDTLRTSEISLFGDNVSEQKRIQIASDFLDAELTSRLNVVDIVPYARQTIHFYLPSLDSIRTVPPSEHLQAQLDSNRLTSAANYYGLKAQIKENSQKVTTALLPGLYISPGTNLSLLFNPAVRDFSMVMNSELIEYKNMYAANLNLTNRNAADSIALYLRTDEAGIGNFFIPELTVHGGVRDEMIHISAGFNNPYNDMSAMINTISRLRPDTVTRKAEWHTRFTASRIRIGEQEWRVTSPSIVWGGERVDINQFRILTEGQNFLLDGRISALPTDTLHLTMNNFDLSPLSGLIDRHGYNLTGRTDGHADLIAGKGDALFYGRIELRDVEVNQRPLSNSTFTSEWDPHFDRVSMSLVLENQDTILWGRYRPGDQRYYVNAHFPKIDLSLLTPVLDGVLTDIEGTAEANLRLQGTGGVPSLNGSITVPEFAGTVDFTRARYHLKEAEIKIEDNNLILPKTPIYDQEGGEGDVELALRTRYFSQMSYDVKVTPRKMLALNTTVQDNDYFYGKAYASGNVSIQGDRRGVNMVMNIDTEDNSTFIMPLSGASSLAEADFIVFEDPNAPREETPLSRFERRRQQRNRRGNAPGQNDLDIKMTVNVRPNTDVELQFDPLLGDIIYANGSGRLDIHVRPKEDILTMIGDYRINEGKYNFTLMSLLSKRFTTEQGGYIQWTGDPLDAILNVTATYRTRPSGTPLGYSQTIPVDCKLLLTDRLSQPTINFDVVVPTADPELRSMLQSLLSTNEMKSQQFIWLLMANTFYVDSGEGMSNIGSTASAATGIEFLTNQFSSWLSTERFSFNIGYNARRSDDILSDELEGMFSGEIIPNKLLFEGEVNYNLGDKDTDPREHQFSGDFYLTYIIGRSGNLRTKVFSRTIDRYDENQGLQEQGIGIYYQRDFNHWREIFRRRRLRNRLAPGEQEEKVLEQEREALLPILEGAPIEGEENTRSGPGT